MEEESNIDRIEWKDFEYSHKEHSADWYWTIGLITLAIFISAIWTKGYLFSIFIIISGASLIMFSLRHPQEIDFSIDVDGIFMGRDKYSWEKIKGFNIKKRDGQTKLLIEIDKYFLPVYTIPIPEELVPQIKKVLLDTIPVLELNESGSMQFVEKLGF